MDKRSVLSRLGRMRELSAPSPILQAILNLLNSPDVSARELADVVLKDPILTARVLRVANSSFYGYCKKISTAQQAVMVMGINAVKYFVLSISVLHHLLTQKEKSGLDHKQLWTSFLEAANAAKGLAACVRYPEGEEAYVAGLLHDLGIVILEREFPSEYQMVLKRVADGEPLTQAETSVFGLDHQEAGHLLVAAWNLPPIICEVIAGHHLEKDMDFTNLPALVKIVAMADCMATVPFVEMRGLQNAELRLELLELIAGQLGIEFAQLKEVHRRLAGEVAISATAMDLDIGDAMEILSRSNAELFNIYLELAALFKERRELSLEILRDERMRGTIESLRIAIATLAHYINNATMNIQGKCEMMRMMIKRKPEELNSQLPGYLDSIENSVKRITFVLDELSEISSHDKLTFFAHSKAINIEKSIRDRLGTLLSDQDEHQVATSQA